MIFNNNKNRLIIVDRRFSRVAVCRPTGVAYALRRIWACTQGSVKHFTGRSDGFRESKKIGKHRFL